LAGGEAPAAAFGLDEVPGVAVEALPAEGHKCARCWRVLPEVKAPTFLCERCEDAVTIWAARAA
jgi:isoleucyl-tRNA synthetase